MVDSPVVDTPAASDWDGFYVGVFGGYAQGTVTTTDNDLLTSPFDESYEGYLLGVAAGYNFTLSDNVVGGFQADLAFNNAATEYDSYDIAVDYSGSLTARVGLDLGGFVPYALGGISFASASVTDRNVPTPVTDDAFHAGYVLGVGGEVSLTENLAANLEYRYTNYGTQIYDLADVTSAELADSSVRGGLNFRF
jgi:outer membrane immunogenic protein